MIQISLTFESKDMTLKCDHSLESCSAVVYCGAVYPVGKLSILDSALSGVRGLNTDLQRGVHATVR